MSASAKENGRKLIRGNVTSIPFLSTLSLRRCRPSASRIVDDVVHFQCQIVQTSVSQNRPYFLAFSRLPQSRQMRSVSISTMAAQLSTHSMGHMGPKYRGRRANHRKPCEGRPGRRHVSIRFDPTANCPPLIRIVPTLIRTASNDGIITRSDLQCTASRVEH